MSLVPSGSEAGAGEARLEPASRGSRGPSEDTLLQGQKREERLGVHVL